YMCMLFTQLTVMVAGTYFVIGDSITYGEFVAFLLLVNVFFRPIEKLNAVLEIYPKGIAGFRRYVELLDTKPEIQDKEGAVDAGDLKGDIRFENVSFGYTDDKMVLKNINLEIHPGDTVAFVGPSGAGKTTISSLLPRFYDVNSGRITIDGTDIRDMTLDSLRREIG